jgi:hypothetical protein
MPVTKSPEPWSGKTRIDRKGRISIYDAESLLVAHCVRRAGEHKAEDVDAVNRGVRQRAQRICICVNACKNIPNSLLEKHGVIGLAIELMRRACDFGDLHLMTLPDRIESNMLDIFTSGYFEEGDEA